MRFACCLIRRNPPPPSLAADLRLRGKVVCSEHALGRGVVLRLFCCCGVGDVACSLFPLYTEKSADFDASNFSKYPLVFGVCACACGGRDMRFSRPCCSCLGGMLFKLFILLSLSACVWVWVWCACACARVVLLSDAVNSSKDDMCLAFFYQRVW